MKFKMEGLDTLIMDLEELADLPDAVLREMLEAEAEVVRAAQVRSIQETFSAERTHQLEASIQIGKMTRRKGEAALYLTPSGTRENGVRNVEVGFVEEFGAKDRNIPAHQWMRKANESAADEGVQSAVEVYDRYLKSKNL